MFTLLEGSLPVIDLTGVDMGAVLDGITGMLPTVLPVVIGFIAFRKGLGFLKGQLKSA